MAARRAAGRSGGGVSWFGRRPLGGAGGRPRCLRAPPTPADGGAPRRRRHRVGGASAGDGACSDGGGARGPRMVRCSMMPVASGPGVPAPRPKLGFSIDSLVGDGADSPRSPAARSGSEPTPTPASPEPRRKERSPPRERERRDPEPADVTEAPEAFELPPETDMLQQRLAHERALHERLLAHGLGSSPLGAFGPLAPLARLPLADPRYMKLAQLRGELALGRAGGGVPAGLPGLLSHPPAAPAAPSEMPLYPWLMSRHGRVFPGRYAPGESVLLSLCCSVFSR